MLKKISFLVLCLLSLLGLGSIRVKAQVDLPLLYVNDVKLEKNDNFNVGDSVNGYFTLVNKSDYDVIGAKVSYYLVSKDEKTGIDNFIVPILENQSLDPVSKRSSKTINFSDLIIPKLAHKDSYVKVQLSTNIGMNLGWGYSNKLIVLGSDTLSISLVGTRIRLDNDKTFPTDHGPHIYKNGKPTKAFLEFLLSNPSTNDVEVFLSINIKKRGDLTKGDGLNFMSGGLSVKSNDKEKVVTIELPSFDYQAGVYEGDSVLIDKEGKEVSSHIPFRYIVAGKMFVVHSLTSNQSSVNKGDKFIVSASVSGTPIDIDNNNINLDQTEFYKDVRLDLRVKNERGSVISKDSKSVMNQNGIYSFDLIAGKSAKAMTAELEVFSEGKSIMIYNIDLSHNFKDFEKPLGVSGYWYLLGFVLLIILVLFLFKAKNKIKFLVLFVLVTLSFSVKTNAFTTVSSFSDMGASFDGGATYQNVYVNIFVNTPQEEERLNPNESFSLTGSIQYPHCTNSSNNTSGVAWIGNLNGSEVSSRKSLKSVSNAAGGQHSWSFPSYNLDPVNFNAPQAFGEYRVYTNATTTFDSWGKYTSILGYVKIFVVPFSPTNFTVTVGSTCSPDITLSWTAPTNMDGVDGFKLYRSTSENGTYDLVTTLATTETSYVDTLTSLVPGTFYYKLTAYDTESGLESDPATAEYIYPESCRNGLCKTPPNNSEVTSEPVAISVNLCDQGLLSVTEPFSSTVIRNETTNRDQTTYNWKCVGTDENQKATCSATLQFTGVCASQATIESFVDIDPSSLCSSGITAELETTANGYSWKCYGSDPSRDVSCSFNDNTPVNGECGTKNTKNVTEGYSFSPTDLCLSGNSPTPHYNTDNTYIWSCGGLNGGTSSGQCRAYTGATQAECVVYPQPLDNAPSGSSNLCVSGDAGNVSPYGADRYIWSCTSPDGSITRVCTAGKSGYGVCGDRSYPLNSNQTSLCATGSTLVARPSDQGDFYQWQCKGTNNNPDAYATCKSYKGPACAIGLDFAEMPLETNSSLCDVGSAQDVTFNQSQNRFEWHCIKDNQTSSLCSADKTAVPPGVPAVSTIPRCSFVDGASRHIIDVALNGNGGSLPITYSVYRSLQSSNDIAYYALIGSKTVTSATSFNIYIDSSNLNPNSTYYYKVKAENVAGVSGYSSKVSGTTFTSCEPVESSCGLATEHSMVYMPGLSTPNLCSDGVPSNFGFDSVSDMFTWDCSVGSGSSSSCSAPKADSNDVACGDATGDSFSSAPSVTNPNLCDPGTPSNIEEETGGFSWKCSSLDSSTETTCSANKVCSGSCGGGEGNYPSCGSAQNVAMNSLPTENGTPNLCSNGSVVSGSILSVYGGYSWQCRLDSVNTDCFAQKNGFVPPGVLCPSGDCSEEDGEVELRDLVAYPAIGNPGYQCTILLGDTTNNYSVFAKRDSNTKCALTGPNGYINNDISPNGNYQKSYPFTINTQTTYRLTCWQESDAGVKDQSSEVYKEVTCKINPSYVETSFIRRLFSNIKSMSASVLHAFGSLFNSN